jgi:hypothetical protein
MPAGRHRRRVARFYGVQFHPEVTHTRQGQRILERFCHEICGCGNLWTPSQHHRRRHRAVRATRSATTGAARPVRRRRLVRGRRAAAPRHRRSAHLRLRRQRPAAPGEGDQVMATFARHMGVRVIRVDAEERFLSARRRRRPGAEAQASSATPSSRSSTPRPASSRASNGWPRAPSTRTSSNPPAPRPARPRSSSPTTTSAACRRT